MGDENLDRSCRTLFCTSAASRTLIIINLRAIIHNCDSSVRTSSFALLASDAGILTDLASLSATVGTAANNRNGGGARNHGNDVFGTYLLAKSAAYTAISVNVGDAVLHADRANGAN